MRFITEPTARWARVAWVSAATMVVGFGIAACRSTTEPLPANAESFKPAAVYARWWAMTATCSGHTSDLASVQWYRVPGSLVSLNGQWVAGYYDARAHRVVLAEDQVDHGIVVRHEMLHALLRTGLHPRPAFLQACASIVDCSGICITDGGPWRAPRPDYVAMAPESLEVSSESELLAPEADGQRFVALQLRVRNPQDRAVVISAPGSSLNPPTFGFDVRGPAGGLSANDVASDSSTLFFQPHETKTRLFEFRVTSELTSHRIPLGTHLIRGGYAQLWDGYDTVLVAP